MGVKELVRNHGHIDTDHIFLSTPKKDCDSKYKVTTLKWTKVNTESNFI